MTTLCIPTSLKFRVQGSIYRRLQFLAVTRISRHTWEPEVPLTLNARALLGGFGDRLSGSGIVRPVPHFQEGVDDGFHNETPGVRLDQAA